MTLVNAYFTNKKFSKSYKTGKVKKNYSHKKDLRNQVISVISTQLTWVNKQLSQLLYLKKLWKCWLYLINFTQLSLVEHVDTTQLSKFNTSVFKVHKPLLSW